jgi:hypothetical protein
MPIWVEVEAHGRLSSQSVESRSHFPGDNVDQMIAGIYTYERAGVETIILALNSGDVPLVTELLEGIARRVMLQCS